VLEPGMHGHALTGILVGLAFVAFGTCILLLARRVSA
jgi:hypothetical protein